MSKDVEVTNIHSHSAFSFQDGVCSPEEMIIAAKAKGLRSLALTDHGHCHGHSDFLLAARKHDFKAIFGVEAYIINDIDEWKALKEKIALEKKKDAEEIDMDLDKAAQDKTNRKALYRKGHLVLIAQNRVGLSNIYQIVHKAHKLGMYGKPRADKKILSDHAEGVIASSACMGGVLSVKCWSMERGETTWEEIVQEARELGQIFQGRFFLELQANEHEGQKFINSCMVRLHYETGLPLIVTMDSHYVDPAHWETQEVLHMLMTHRGGSGITMGNKPPTYDFKVRNLYIKSGYELYESFLKYNPETPKELLDVAFANTILVDSMVERFEPDTTQRLPTLPFEDTFAELVKQAGTGLQQRGLDKDDRYVERLVYELQVIKEKGIANYFLVVKQITDRARKDMLVGPGRGSAAGSLICYLCGITNIDPIEHKLMFERFINLDRIETPDIDLDFQDVDQVKEFLREIFGQDNVACISTYGTNQIKTLIKDLCRVYDIEHTEANRANGQIEKEMKAIIKEGETRSAITVKLDDIYRLSPTFNRFMHDHPEIEKSITALYGKPHHVGRHASGVVIGDNLPSETAVLVSKGILQTSATDGIVNKNLSMLGLVKFDILSLATLEVLHRACQIIAKRNGRQYEDVLNEIDPKKMDFNNEKIMKTVFWEGNLCGIFQVTSSGMAKLLQRVKPTCFDDVAAVCALYRPGPLGSGMDKMFSDRKNGIEAATYDHPILEEIMRDTYGCLVYQEQMLEVGRRMGQMSWKDTNRLRKLFLKKDKSKQDEYIKKEEDELQSKLVAGVMANGLSEKKGYGLWEMLSKFGGYGFNASHAKAYGMVTMQTAYLRTYYPLEFFSALLSAGQAGDLQGYVNDIRKQGFNVLPVDVNYSQTEHILEGDAIRLSLLSVKGVGGAAVEKIILNQPYENFLDFVVRSGSNKTVTEALLRVGAFTGIEPGVSISTLLLKHSVYYGDTKLRQKKNRELLESIMAAQWGKKDDPIELMEMERELLGFNLRNSPFSINNREEKVKKLIEVGLGSSIREFLDDEEQAVGVCPLLLKSFKERPQRNGQMFAFLKLADQDGLEIEAPCFGNIWSHISKGVRPGNVYVVVLHRKEDEPQNLVVGKPGWKHSESQAVSYFIPLDQIEI